MALCVKVGFSKVFVDACGRGRRFLGSRCRRGYRANFLLDQRGEPVSAFLEEGNELVDLVGECRECVPFQEGAVVRSAAVLSGGLEQLRSGWIPRGKMAMAVAAVPERVRMEWTGSGCEGNHVIRADPAVPR